MLQEKIEGDLDLDNIQITILGNVKVVTGWISLKFNKTLKSLGNLESCIELYIEKSNIEDLSNLKSCNGIWLSKDTKVPKEQYEKFNHHFSEYY